MTNELMVDDPVQSMPAGSWFDLLRQVVLDGVSAENSKRNYALAMDELSAFCGDRQKPVSRTKRRTHTEATWAD